MELCPDAESAIHKLTRRRFEAVIVDCTDQRTGSRVLRIARSAPVNKRAVAVAIVAAVSTLGRLQGPGSAFRSSSATFSRTRQNQLSRRARFDETRTPPQCPHPSRDSSHHSGERRGRTDARRQQRYRRRRHRNPVGSPSQKYRKGNSAVFIARHGRQHRMCRRSRLGESRTPGRSPLPEYGSCNARDG